MPKATLCLVAELGREPRANPVFLPLHGLPLAKGREIPAINRGNRHVRVKGNAINNCMRTTGTHRAVPSKVGHMVT